MAEKARTWANKLGGIGDRVAVELLERSHVFIDTDRVAFLMALHGLVHLPLRCVLSSWPKPESTDIHEHHRRKLEHVPVDVLNRAMTLCISLRSLDASNCTRCAFLTSSSSAVVAMSMTIMTNDRMSEGLMDALAASSAAESLESLDLGVKDHYRECSAITDALLEKLSAFPRLR